MGVSLECYRAAIGLFNCRISVVSTVNFSFVFLNIMVGCLQLLMVLALFFMICFDVELNPGPYQNVNLKIAHLNIRSLNAPNKFGEIASAILNHKFDLFALSETWLNDSISNDLFSIPGYCPLIRLDISDGRRSGGVAVYVTTSIAVKRRNNLETCGFELLWVELKVGSDNLICGICYRPPGGDLISNARFLDNLQRCLDKINIQPNSLITIIGDFNAHYDSTNQSESTDFGCLLYRWMECRLTTYFK